MSSAQSNTEPRWKSEYPVCQKEEHQSSRRSFAKFLGLSAVAAAGAVFAKERILYRPTSGKAVRVCAANDLAVGEYRLLRYPTEGDPCILIRLTETDLVAYSQACTHLSCPVHYNHDKQQLVCPCHAGFFNAKDGSVISGPPPQPLPSYAVEIIDGSIYVG